MHGACFLNRALHCNHRCGHLKTEHTESLFPLRRHLGNWPCSKHEKRTAGSAWETLTVAAADGVRCARVRWEINFLLIFETAPFFCKHPVFPWYVVYHISWCHLLNLLWNCVYSTANFSCFSNIDPHVHQRRTVKVNCETPVRFNYRTDSVVVPNKVFQ